jgi:hypothetical protein
MTTIVGNLSSNELVLHTEYGVWDREGPVWGPFAFSLEGFEGLIVDFGVGDFAGV